MNTLESQLFKRMIVYMLLGLVLRLMMYGVPHLDELWLLLGLSFSIGIGGSALTWWKETQDRRVAFLGLILMIIGLFPLHYML